MQAIIVFKHRNTQIQHYMQDTETKIACTVIILK